MTQQEGRTSPDAIIGILLIFSHPAFILINPGATHSFMSSRFSFLANVPSSPLPGEWLVSLPSGDVLKIDWVFRGCEVLVEGLSFEVDLIPLDIVKFDVISGMDFLKAHRAMINCFWKIVVLQSPRKPEAYLAHVVDTRKEEVRMEDIPVVNKFPDELPRLPPVREIDFTIELLLGTAPISQALYRMAPLSSYLHKYHQGPW
ncbi:hypothetical protein ACLB2K_029157 [Fragaria x ananassa]